MSHLWSPRDEISEQERWNRTILAKCRVAAAFGCTVVLSTEEHGDLAITPEWAAEQLREIGHVDIPVPEGFVKNTGHYR